MNKLEKAIKEIRDVRIAREKESKEKEMDDWFNGLSFQMKVSVAHNLWEGATYEQKKEEYEIE